ncbi:Ethylene-responsive transcription factor ERF019 [Acorus gramineus]|uniref:Ethylene-responsive transcription factor ERF019 n=1 Tax=Acorus gramineus TaxID=55184 RepID=A0AAV9BHK3_ACOGR|nr:Ethylene-responsive transcription factor ERF019 [Acorus gramineus]
MSGSDSGEGSKRYKGVRRRRWGKWVSEIRVPGTRERLWLGSYASAEAAAVAHDTAICCLRGSAVAAAAGRLNFPSRAEAYCYRAADLSPRSVQRVASNAGMAVDAGVVGGSMVEERRHRAVTALGNVEVGAAEGWGGEGGFSRAHEEGELTISVDDMEICL